MHYGIILFGVVSLFGDIVYEGARSAVPEYMKIMGASATFVGLIIGFGEFLAYAIRLPAGSFVDIFGRILSQHFLSTAGFVHFALLSYRLQGLVPDWLVAFSFSLAMAIDAIFALFLGFLYDKYKLKVFYFIFIANTLPAILAIFPNPMLLVLAIASFGIGMGAQESIYRSVIADLTPIHLRGTAYGIFNTLY
ncbi:MAG: MFS transporter, partial [Thermoproteota archaeon]